MSIANTIFCPQLPQGDISLFVPSAYLADILSSEFGKAIQFTFQAGHSSFFSSIVHIILTRPQPKVGRIDTARIVARVANQQIIRPNASSKPKSKTVGMSHSTIEAKMAIAGIATTPEPFPAIAWTGHSDFSVKSSNV